MACQPIRRPFTTGLAAASLPPAIPAIVRVLGARHPAVRIRMDA